jgi:hypothetical protein
MMVIWTANLSDPSDAEGSIDIYLGPEPPAGMQSNWIPAQPGIVAFVPFRAHGPQPPLLTKT